MYITHLIDKTDKTNNISNKSLWQSGTFISLFDMIEKLEITSLIAAYAIIHHLQNMLSTEKVFKDHEPFIFVRDQLKLARKLLSSYDLGNIDDLFENTYRSIEESSFKPYLGNDNYKEFVLGCVNGIDTVISHELKSQQCYILPRNLIRYSDTESLKFEEFSKISGCLFEMKEAQLCLVFGRDTACVFHCMCALENVWPTIENIVQKHGISWSLGSVAFGKNWGNLLNELDKEIKETKQKHKAKQNKGMLETLSNISAHMRAIKEAWRDDTMHARGPFSQKVAIDVFNTTCIFLNYLASLED